MKAVRFEQYGDVDVLNVLEVPRPQPGAGQVLVRVRAAGINPGEISIRQGLLHDRWPATFPSGQGSDFAGVVEELGAGVETFAPGDAVIGYTDDRGSQAEFVAVDAGHLTPKPEAVPWEVAGALHVAGATALAAVRAVAPAAGENVVVSGAAGGVGSLAVQLARHTGAAVFGLASEPNHAWLLAHDIVPLTYGEGVGGRIGEATGDRVDAFIDTFGGGYVEMAVELGVRPERIDTIIDYAAAQRFGAKTDASAVGAGADTLAQLARLIADGELELPVAATYPLEQVREAYTELARRHTHGKIVLTT